MRVKQRYCRLDRSYGDLPVGAVFRMAQDSVLMMKTPSHATCLGSGGNVHFTDEVRVVPVEGAFVEGAE